jgi:hypothetical protein
MFALLWQHVFQAVVCIECRAECDYVTVTLCIGSLKMVQLDRNMSERMHRCFNCKF